jgi:hypothetical protein
VPSVSPEGPPSVSSGSPEQLPCSRVYDGRAPPCVAGGPNRPWAELPLLGRPGWKEWVMLLFDLF